MIVNLMKPTRMFSLTLPDKVNGQYWLTDIDDNGHLRELVSIEGIKGQWVAKSNKTVAIMNPDRSIEKNTILNPLDFFGLKIKNSNERVLLFTESMDRGRQSFRKLIVRKPDSFHIGRTDDNDICYANKFVSGKHAVLSYDGENWTVADSNSVNGTFVNGRRIQTETLHPGDLIYIMGLRIAVGHGFLAVNDPEGKVRINANCLSAFPPQSVQEREYETEISGGESFFRSPRFHREIEPAVITIDPPPQLQKQETVPMALMLGPSLTKGMTSASTGILSVANVINNGGNISQALPTLIMSGGMLLGTILWPILTKKYEKKSRILAEKRRQEKYLAYLDEVRDTIRRKCKEQSDILNENIADPADCAKRIVERRTDLWNRSPQHNDFLTLRLGVGDLPLAAEVQCGEKHFSMDDDSLQDAMLTLSAEPKKLSGVPVSISMTQNVSVGIYGQYSQTRALLRSLLLQMLALHSYDELKVVMILSEEESDDWGAIRFAPHAWNRDKTVRFFASNESEVKELSVYLEKDVISRMVDDEKDKNTFSPYYVVIVTNKELADKCGAVQALLSSKGRCGASVIFVEEQLRSLPRETEMVVHINGNESRIFDRNDTSGTFLSFAPDDTHDIDLEKVAACVANISVDTGEESITLPDMVTFLEMFRVGKVEHLNSLARWHENNPTITLQTPVGVNTSGELFWLDLHEKYHGPHGLVAGMTGSGKSEFIITFILSLAVNYHPDEVSFILIDYKGGGLAGAFEDADRGIRLPHLAGTITNLDGAAIKRSLISIQSELRRRQAIFNDARKAANEGTMDIYKYQQLYREGIVKQPVPHLFIISDEFAELKAQQPEFMEQLISAARIGRSLGVHLILATQKPNGVVDDQIWSNSKFRVCLKVQEKADSQDMIKCSDAAELVQTGRFYLQVGFNELFALGQSAWCGAEYQPSDEVLKPVDNSIQVVDHIGRVLLNVKPGKKRNATGEKIKQIVAIVKYLSNLAVEERISPHQLWLDPIPAKIVVRDLERKYRTTDTGLTLCPVIGEYDDPYNQRQNVLTVPLSADGNCLVYGAAGSGKTTFVTTLCYTLIKNHTPGELNLYIMDYGTETLRVFDGAPHVGGVVVASEEEKTVNLMKMLHGEIERRKTLFSQYGGDLHSYCRLSGQTLPNIVVVINNISGFTEQYEELQDSFAILSREGIKYGVFFVVTASSTNAVRYRISQNFKTVLTMQLNDAAEYSTIVGRTEGLIPSKFEGRGLIRMDNVYEFQTAICVNVEDQYGYLRDFVAEEAKKYDSWAKRIPVLPEVVKYRDVQEFAGNLNRVPVGIDKQSLSIAAMDLSDKLVTPVAAQSLMDAAPFAEEWQRVLEKLQNVTILDMEGIAAPKESAYTVDYELLAQELFADMVRRNNTFKDANMDMDALEDFEEKMYVIIGFNRFMERLSEDGRDKMKVLLERGEAFYKIRFILVDSAAHFGAYNYEGWYKRHISGADGLWIGDGVTDQYLLKVNKLSSDLYQELGTEYGYLFKRGRMTQVKLLNAMEEEA